MPSKKSRKFWHIFFASFVAVSLILEILFRVSVSFSEFWCTNISPVIKFIYYPFAIFPFAVSESIILMLLLLALFIVFSLVFRVFCKIFKKSFPFRLSTLVLFFSRSLIIILFLFSTTLSSSYHRRAFEENYPIQTSAVTEKALTDAASFIADELCQLQDSLVFVPESMSYSGMDFDQLSKSVKKETYKLCTQTDFLTYSPILAKPVALSIPLTYAHIAGIYTFFTGEPCINTNYAQYTQPFTIAHEYAHQCGIGAENEADFFAFLTLFNSEKPYLKYSALMEAFTVLANELYEINADAYFEIYSKLPQISKNDYSISTRYYSKYSDTKIDDISGTLNDTYLKAQGVEEGVKSYNKSVVLIVSYVNSINERSKA